MTTIIDHTYKSVAKICTENGYPIIPILPGRKEPAVKNWVEFRTSAAAEKKYSGCGVGLLCGANVEGTYPLCAVDIDITDKRLADNMSTLVCERLGEGLSRVGKAPKIMHLYKAESPGWRKMTSKVYNCGRLEVLGYGQQVVAFGIHPDTKQPYTWEGIFGDPTEHAAGILPTVTKEQIEEIVSLFEQEAEAAGYVELKPGSSDFTSDDIIPASQDTVGITIDEAKDYISYINADERDTWVEVGMALHHEFRGSAEALELWDTWSAGSEKYKSDECEYLWNGFGKREGETFQITFRSVMSRSKAIQAQQKVDHEAANYNLLHSDIESCDDYNLLINVLGHRVVAEGYTDATKLRLFKEIARKAGALIGDRVSYSQVVEMVETIAESGDIKYEASEMGNAKRMIDKYGSRIMYLPHTDTWYLWNRGRWYSAVRQQILRLAEKTVLSIKDDVDRCQSEKAKKRLSSWYNASQRSYMLESMLALIQKDPAIMVSPSDIDCHRHLIGCENGILNTRTCVLMPPDPKARVTKNTCVVYSEEAEAPIFEETVLDVFDGDKELAAFLKRLIGYAIIGHPEREEIIVIPEGRGANGKSTVFNAIHHALGEYARYTSADTFTNQNQASGNSAREDVLRLLNSRFVYVTEIEENGVLKESFVKSITGGEAIPARGLYSKHSVEVYPTWVAFMPTNHLPIIKGDDKGIWRKIVVLPFRRDFTNDPFLTKDVKRKDKLKAEAPGILKWCVEGALDYRQNGLRIPSSISTATVAYQSDMDVLGEWIDACCAIDRTTETRLSELWRSYSAYIAAEGITDYIKSSKAFGRRLVQRGFQRVDIGVGKRKERGLLGLRIASTTDFE